MSEFKLYEKREEIRQIIIKSNLSLETADKIWKLIKEKDRGFIRRLKEEIYNREKQIISFKNKNYGAGWQEAMNEFKRIINKLAGEKLI